MTGFAISRLRQALPILVTYVTAVVLAVAISSLVVAIFRPKSLGGLTFPAAWREVWGEIALHDVLAAWPLLLVVALGQLAVYSIVKLHREGIFLSLVAAGQICVALLMQSQLQ